MNRILVMGVSAGVGKTTFARELGGILQIEVYHLDKLFWKPNWIQSSLEEFAFHQKEIVQKENWIIEGNYRNTYDIRLENANTIIYLELPLRVCLYRVVKRWFKNIGKTRPDMGEGCKEKLDYQFIKFIITTYHDRKDKLRLLFKEFANMGKDRQVTILKNKREIERYLVSLREVS